MSANAARRSASESSRPQLLSIGQVLAKLTPEFSDLSPSKLRFLEDRELVSPGRTPAGYRTYSSSDVDRLRFVLTVQRDHYLPLRVIKQYLDELDEGKSPVLPHAGPVTGSVKVIDSQRLTKQELLDQTGALASVLEGAITAGLIEPKRIYSEHDAVVLKSIVDASKFGLEPRHLRGMRLAVDREVGLVSQAVSASRSASKKMSRDEFRDKGRELSDILSTLRQVLTRDAINKLES
ncbi:MAG: MerR family transcriptional regulator [Pontimonas sp.]|nr:MerR family transcriptional regulator [Pontimonas sp.]MDP4816213.1 MerR family transcriptional regulator [Pontimonas sp.]MDP4972478.1 MerR family transcriptional regulator [Pontimonas sp.]